MKRFEIGLLIVVLLAAPASAQWVVDSPVADAHATTQLAKQLQELQQQITLVQTAQQNLRALPASFRGGSIAGALSNVSSLLQVAQQECVNANQGNSAAWQAQENASKQAWMSGSGAALPTPSQPAPQTSAQRCQITSAVANQQAATLGQSAAEIGSIQNAGAGSTGSLQALQAAVSGIAKLAIQNDQATQREIGKAQQDAADYATRQRVYSGGTVQP